MSPGALFSIEDVLAGILDRLITWGTQTEDTSAPAVDYDVACRPTVMKLAVELAIGEFREFCEQQRTAKGLLQEQRQRTTPTGLLCGRVRPTYYSCMAPTKARMSC